MKRLFHSQTDAWEVVDQKTVDTVPAFTLQERDNMDVEEVYDATMSGVYTFEMKQVTHLRGAVVFARQLLLQEAEAKGYNVFLTEGWKVTHLRKGKQERVEVHYWGRPAFASGKPVQSHEPPFLAMLNERTGA